MATCANSLHLTRLLSVFKGQANGWCYVQDLDHKGKKADIALVFNDIVIRKITAHKIFTSLLNLSLEAQKFSDRPLSRAVGLLLEPVVQEASGSKQIYNNKIMTKSGYDQTSDSNRTVTGFDKTRHLENVRDAVQNSQHLHVLDSLHKRLNSNAAVVNLLYNASSYHALPGAISGSISQFTCQCYSIVYSFSLALSCFRRSTASVRPQKQYLMDCHGSWKSCRL